MRSEMIQPQIYNKKYTIMAEFDEKESGFVVDLYGDEFSG